MNADVLYPDWKLKLIVASIIFAATSPARSESIKIKRTLGNDFWGDFVRLRQICWYHKTKHRKGISDKCYKTKEERRIRQREGERRRYAESRLKIGLLVKKKRKPGEVTPEQRKAEMLARCAKWIASNKEKRRESARNWARRNRLKTQKKAVERYRSDAVFNIVMKIRRRIYMSIKRHSKSGKLDKTINLLGCSFNDFKTHIESRFSEGMSWDGVMSGKIAIDHIVPIAAHNMNTKEGQIAAFHYTNTQPMWHKDNLSKSSIYNGKRWYYSDHIKQAA